MAEKNDGFSIKVTAPPFRASIKSPNVSVSLRSLVNSRIPTNKMIFQSPNFRVVDLIFLVKQNMDIRTKNSHPPFSLVTVCAVLISREEDDL